MATTMSAVYYLALFDECLLHHSAELSILTTDKCKKSFLKLEELVAICGNQQFFFCNFLHWLFADHEKRSFVEKNCCIEIHGCEETLQITISASSRCMFYTMKLNKDWMNRCSSHWITYNRKNNRQKNMLSFPSRDHSYESQMGPRQIVEVKNIREVYPKIRLDSNNKVNIDVMEKHIQLLRSQVSSRKNKLKFSGSISDSTLSISPISEESLSDTVAEEENSSSPDLAGKVLNESDSLKGDLFKVNVSAASCALTVTSIDPSDSCDNCDSFGDNLENQDTSIVAPYKEHSTHSIDSNSTCTIELPAEMNSLCHLFGIRTLGVFSGEYLYKKFGNDFFRKSRFFWLDPNTRSLNWRKCHDVLEVSGVNCTKYLLLKRFHSPASKSHSRGRSGGLKLPNSSPVSHSGQLQGVVHDVSFDSSGVSIVTENGVKMHIQIPSVSLACWQRAILTLLQ